MYQETLEALGLAKNEARLYESLLKYGELSVSKLSTISGVHRRNVYDSLSRLSDKGLVFELIGKGDTRYQAVDPDKLMELVREKEDRLSAILPGLHNLYEGTPHNDSVLIYKGPEGWKNYMRDILRVGEPVYFIGAKGGWLDDRVKHFFPAFLREVERKNISFYHLFDHAVLEQVPEIIPIAGDNHRFLPEGFDTPVAVDIFGDHVTTISGMTYGGLEEEFSLTVTVNQQTADAYRTWFRLLWEQASFQPKT